MLNPITAITGVITARDDRQLLAGPEWYEVPPGVGRPQLALLAVCDEQGRPLAGVYVPDSLLL
jgi:hypothetical protein